MENTDIQKIQDPRMEGLKGLSGLKGVSHPASTTADNELLNLNKQVNPVNIHTIGALQEASENPFGAIGAKVYESNPEFGKSIYDRRIDTLQELNNFEEHRAQQQSGVIQFANGLTKGAITAGTTFLDGTVGLLYGLYTGIQNKKDGDSNTGFWEGLWNNEFSKGMDAIKQESEKWLPNYYSEYEKEHPMNLASANFWGDKFLKNVGFTVGAFYSGGVEAGLTRGIGKLALKGAKSLRGAKMTTDALRTGYKISYATAEAIGIGTAALNEGRIEALNTADEWRKAQIAMLDEDMQYNMQSIDYLRDSNPELYQTYVTNLQANRQAKIQQLDANYAHIGNLDMALNMPILAASNWFQFGRVFARGFNSYGKNIWYSRKAGKFVTDAENRSVGKALLKGMGNALSEGKEEVLQQLASDFSGMFYSPSDKDFYNLRFDAANVDPTSNYQTVNWLKSFGKSWSETMSDESTFEQFVIGAMTGFLGMPVFGKANTKNAYIGRNKRIGLAGGMFGELRERNQLAEVQPILDKLNNRVQDSKFKAYYQGMIRHNKFENIMKAASIAGNKKMFKDSEYAQLVSDIQLFTETGQLDDFKAIFQDIDNLSDDDIRSIVNDTAHIGNEFGKTSNGQTIVSAFTDKYGNIKDVKDIRKSLEKSKKQIYRAVDDYNDSLEYVNEKFKKFDLTDDERNEIVWTRMRSIGARQRGVELSGDIKDRLQTIYDNLDSSLFKTKKGYAQFAEQLQHLLSFSDKKLFNELSTLDIDSNSKNYTQWFKKFESAIKPVFAEYDSFIQDVADVYKLYDDSFEFADLFESYMKDPSKLRKEQVKQKQQATQQQQTVNQQAKNSSLDNIKTFEEARTAYLEGFENMTEEPISEHNKRFSSSNNPVVKQFQTFITRYTGLWNNVASTADNTLKNKAFDILKQWFRTAKSPTDQFDYATLIQISTNDEADKQKLMELFDKLTNTKHTNDSVVSPSNLDISEITINGNTFRKGETVQFVKNKKKYAGVIRGFVRNMEDANNPSVSVETTDNTVVTTFANSLIKLKPISPVGEILDDSFTDYPQDVMFTDDTPQSDVENPAGTESIGELTETGELKNDEPKETILTDPDTDDSDNNGVVFSGESGQNASEQSADANAGNDESSASNLNRPAPVEYDMNELPKGVFKPLTWGISLWLKAKGAFDFVNSGNLYHLTQNHNVEIVYGIDKSAPVFNDKRPVIIYVRWIEKGEYKYQEIGSNYTDASNKVEGLSELNQRVYDAYDKAGQPDVFHFTDEIYTLNNIKRGRLEFNDTRRNTADCLRIEGMHYAVASYPIIIKKDKIIEYSRTNDSLFCEPDWQHKINNDDSLVNGCAYICIPTANGTYTPVELIPMNIEEASKYDDTIHKFLSKWLYQIADNTTSLSTVLSDFYRYVLCYDLEFHIPQDRSRIIIYERQKDQTGEYLKTGDKYVTKLAGEFSLAGVNDNADIAAGHFIDTIVNGTGLNISKQFNPAKVRINKKDITDSAQRERYFRTTYTYLVSPEIKAGWFEVNMNPAVQNNNTSEQKPTSTKPRKSRIGQRKNTDENSNMFSVQNRKRNTTMTLDEVKQEAVNQLKKILPQLTDRDAINVVENLVSDKNQQLNGVIDLNNAMITLSRLAEEGTAYHEAYHYVSQLMLNVEQRQNIYAEARQKYGDMTDDELEEELADDFRQYMLDRDNSSLGEKIINWFRRLYDYVFHWNTNKMTNDIAGLYRAIAEGRFAYTQTNPESLSKTILQSVDSLVKPSDRADYERRLQVILDAAPRDSEGHLLAPNGKPTHLTDRQYAQVRTKEFKEWFGDWEKLARSSKFRKSLDIPNSLTTATYQGITVGEATFDPDMAPDGGTRIIYLNGKSIGEIPVYEFDDSITMGGSLGAATEIDKNLRGKGYGKKAHIALALIAKAEGKTLYSDSSNSDIEDNLWKSLVKEGIAEVVKEGNKVNNWNHTTYKIINSKLPKADDIKFGDEDVSKVVDENGEPLVVYHGSLAKFEVFDITKKRFDVHKTRGFWFSDKKEIADEYGDNNYECFLNIRKMGISRYEDVAKLTLKKAREVEDEILQQPDTDGARIETSDRKDEEIQFFVKSSNQIKSATDNIGTFSSTNNNIKYSVSHRQRMIDRYVKDGYERRLLENLTDDELEYLNNCKGF